MSGGAQGLLMRQTGGNIRTLVEGHGDFGGVAVR